MEGAGRRTPAPAHPREGLASRRGLRDHRGMTRLLAVLAAAALAACEAPPPPTDAGAETARPAVAQPRPAWTLETSAAGVALIRREASGAEVFRLLCPRSGDLYAELPGLTRIGSEDRLTLGAGDQLAVLVVSMEGADQGLRATGARDPAFLAALSRGQPLAISYSSHQLALGAPPPDARAAFLASCA